MKKEITQLKEKVSALEAKVKELEAPQVIHNHYHTYPSPNVYQPVNTWPQPHFGDPVYAPYVGPTCRATTVTGRADDFVITTCGALQIPTGVSLSN